MLWQIFWKNVESRDCLRPVLIGLQNPNDIRIFACMNSKHCKTLETIFDKPVSNTIKFKDIEKLVIALGGEVVEGTGSRVALYLKGGVKHTHRPHPGKEAKRYQIQEICTWLQSLGVTP